MSTSWAPHLPLEVGTHVMYWWRDQNLQTVNVIDLCKGSTSSPPSDYEYYVHCTSVRC